MKSRKRFSGWLFLAAFALILYGCGASFVESFVNYPTWPLIGAAEFRTFHQALGPLVIGYMVVPMLAGTVLTLLLVWFRPSAIPRWAIWLSFILQMITWIATATVQFPIQMELSSNGLSPGLIERLISTNLWMRKLPQAINVALFIWMMSVMLFRDGIDVETENS